MHVTLLSLDPAGDSQDVDVCTVYFRPSELLACWLDMSNFCDL